MRFIPMNMFYSYNSFSGHCSKCQINCKKRIKKRHNWRSERRPGFFLRSFLSPLFMRFWTVCIKEETLQWIGFFKSLFHFSILILLINFSKPQIIEHANALTFFWPFATCFFSHLQLELPDTPPERRAQPLCPDKENPEEGKGEEASWLRRLITRTSKYLGKPILHLLCKRQAKSLSSLTK